MFKTMTYHGRESLSSGSVDKHAGLLGLLRRLLFSRLVVRGAADLDVVFFLKVVQFSALSRQHFVVNVDSLSQLVPGHHKGWSDFFHCALHKDTVDQSKTLAVVLNLLQGGNHDPEIRRGFLVEVG
jgi:hypothetical protein